MNRLNAASLALGILSFSSCVHAPTPQTTEIVRHDTVEAPVPAPPQVAVIPTTPKADPAGELAAALQGSKLYFEFNSAGLNDAGLQALQRVATVLKHHRTLAVKIEGNCDERGTEEYNLQLGQMRAEAARKYLVNLGVAELQVDAISYGALRPDVPGHDEAAWSKNRRDELHASR